MNLYELVDTRDTHFQCKNLVNTSLSIASCVCGIYNKDMGSNLIIYKFIHKTDDTISKYIVKHLSLSLLYAQHQFPNKSCTNFLFCFSINFVVIITFYYTTTVRQNLLGYVQYLHDRASVHVISPVFFKASRI